MFHLNWSRLLITLAAWCASVTPMLAGPISYAGSTYNQNFDSLAFSGGSTPWSNGTTLLGWSLFQYTGGAISTYNTSTGSSGTGNFYSYGSNLVSTEDRALGGVGSDNAYFGSPGPASGNVAGHIAVNFVNNSASILKSITVTYDGEQWRNGGNSATQTMVMEYGFGTAFGDVTTWTPAGSAFNFASKINTSTAGLLNGNDAANRTAGIGGTITDLSWAVGGSLWIRFIERNDAGADHGLAIDNFSFSASAPPPVAAVPEPTTLSIAFISLAGIGAWRRRRNKPKRARRGERPAVEERHPSRQRRT